MFFGSIITFPIIAHHRRFPAEDATSPASSHVVWRLIFRGLRATFKSNPICGVKYMSLKRLLFGFGTVALAVVSAASSYDVILTSPTWVGTTQLKAGSYKLELQGSNAVFLSGKKTVAETATTVEKGDRKVNATEVETVDSKIKEIRLGGTNS